MASNHSGRLKLKPPITTPHQVDREHITARIITGGTRCVLIRGPAGFGKTTVMLQLRELSEREGIATSWLTLDDADNDVARFLTFFAKVIDVLCGRATEAETTIPSSSENSGNVALDVIDRITEAQGRFILFLDDFEVLRSAAVLGLVARAIESLPEGGCIVIGSRNVPEIGLGRMRARRQLTEIDPAQLRFSLDEAQTFLTKRRGLPLKPEQVASLHRSTEGWVTAIWLASMALERRSDPDGFLRGFSGSNAVIADYLAEDVLAGLAPDLREFLLHTAVLDELGAALCNAVCGRSDSAAVLAELERANLFVTALDDERRWYRYHSLFTDFLRSQLVRQFPDRVRQLHRAAAEWYLGQDRPIPAISHAFASGDSAYALSLLAPRIEALLVQGRLRLLLRWLDALPAGTLNDYPRLRVAHAWAVTFTRGGKEGLSLVESMDAETLEPESQVHLRALRPMTLSMMDHIEESYEQAMDVLPLIPPSNVFAHSMVAQSLVQTCTITGRFSDARKFADIARAGRFSMVLAETGEATLELMQGLLRQATVRLQLAQQHDEDGRPRGRNGNAFQGILLAEVLYEAGECEPARRLLEVYASLVRELALPDKLISGYVLLSRIVHEPDRALHLLTELENIGHRLSLPRVVASARLERVRLALMKGDVQRAGEQLSNCGEDSLWQRVTRQWFVANDTATHSIARLRWLMHSGAASQAITGLKRELEESELGQRHRRALKLRILLSEALERDGQHKQALRMMSRALDFAAAEGFVQTFVEEGAVVEALLRACATSRASTGSSAQDSVANLIERIAPALRSMPAASEGVITGGLAEPLTRKELQVLELLAQGGSNREMADKLFVSETTVRTHLRGINVKLGAGSRTQALVIARRLQLIP